MHLSILHDIMDQWVVDSQMPTSYKLIDVLLLL